MRKNVRGHGHSQKRDSVRFGKGIKKDFMKEVVFKEQVEEQVGFQQVAKEIKVSQKDGMTNPKMQRWKNKRTCLGIDSKYSKKGWEGGEWEQERGIGRERRDMEKNRAMSVEQ